MTDSVSMNEFIFYVLYLTYFLLIALHATRTLAGLGDLVFIYRILWLRDRFKSRAHPPFKTKTKQHLDTCQYLWGISWHFSHFFPSQSSNICGRI